MDATVRKQIILLVDEYTKSSARLHTSFKLANSDCKTIAISDDGFLPDDVCSVYDYFLGDFTKYDTYLGRPRFFNQIIIPKFWEINANMSKGSVNDLNKERARIYYIDSHNNKRRIKVVEWVDDNGKVRLADHYNKYGVLYARTAFSAKGERVNKVYYSSEMKPVIYENFVTGAIILNYDGKERIFSNKSELASHYMTLQGYDNCRVYYNSLWHSFFVSERLNATTKDDILFWQEDERDDVPGNMKIILEGRSKRTQLIIVQKKAAYDKLIELGAPRSIVRLKGYMYPFERENEGRRNILIATNSDQVERIEDIVQALPDVKINIAALTVMSSKLQSLEENKNVALYPCVSEEKYGELLKNCDIYLDINKYDEICDAVYRAFLNNQVIMAFANTAHNTLYEADESIYSEEDWEKMVADVREILDNPEALRKRIEMQHIKALAENEDSYALLK